MGPLHLHILPTLNNIYGFLNVQLSLSLSELLNPTIHFQMGGLAQVTWNQVCRYFGTLFDMRQITLPPLAILTAFFQPNWKVNFLNFTYSAKIDQVFTCLFALFLVSIFLDTIAAVHTQSFSEFYIYWLILFSLD